MKVLAIDSSGQVASVAVADDGKLVSEYMIHSGLTHSQTLLPMIEQMLESSGVDKNDLDAVAISEGPGSFTGLRIGAATAKGLAYGLDIPVVPVSSLMGLAFNLRVTGGVVCAIMDARRSEVYYGIYDFSDVTENSVSDVSLPEKLCDEGAEPIASVIEKIEKLEKNVIFVGDGVPVFEETIKEKLGDRASFAPEELRYQKASSIAMIAGTFLRDGKMMKADEFAPKYLRVSQAERERTEKQEKVMA
ncbi:MAG: tRNA (adenosine(37)-N6)-threonylcarbamoyltransferase complex dimerization subunit type 1 TsaB [Eubacterium sp.]|nr:tRNA (adenosine(37)-N6)-threonylcarbamoyltransferase complex dimerization subunit type 1 TsaB [Eubacterium sp.]